MYTKVLAAAALCSLLAACGGGGGSGSGDAPPSADAPRSNLAIAVAALPSDLPAGSDVQLKVSITNAGPGTATGVELAARFADGLEVADQVACTASGGAVCPGDEDVDLADMPAGSALQFVISAHVPATRRGAMTSILQVAASNDANDADNTAQAVFQVYQADVAVSGTAASALVRAGSATSYTMTVRNTGPDAARDLRIADSLGADQALLGITCTAAGGAICPAALGANMTVPTLPVNATLTFNVSAQVGNGASGAIANILAVSSAGDPVSGNNNASAQSSAFQPRTTAIVLQSDPGDYVVQGEFLTFDRSTAKLTFTASGSQLVVDVAGDATWRGQFNLPSALGQLQPGTYTNLTRAPFRDPAVGGVEWMGDGRACNTITGSITVQSAAYVGGVLDTLDLSFEQHCEGAAPALRGTIHYDAADTTVPPPPVLPVPALLWSPPDGATPASGNYVYLASDAGDFIGAGQTTTLASPTVIDNGFVLHVAGGTWAGDFEWMNSITRLQPGYYPDLLRYPFHNPARGGLSWIGNGRGCNELSGWFVVDSVSYDGGGLAAIDLRFEQHCEKQVPALHGKLHWVR